MDAVTALNELKTAAGRRDPYLQYAAIRAAGPVLALGDQVIVTSYEHANAVLRDPSMRVVDRAILTHQFGPAVAERPAQRLLTDSILNTNPPDHRHMRQAVSAAFTPRRIAAMRSAIEEQALAFVERLGDYGTADFMAGFAVPLPVTVICDLLGVPESDREWFGPVALDFAEAPEFSLIEEAAERADRAAGILRDHFNGLVADRLRTPCDDLTSELAASDAFSGPALLGNLALLLLAGHETTTNLLGNGLAILLDQPDALAGLRDDPGLARAYVEEFLRFDSPVQVVARIPSGPGEVGGVPVGRGTGISVLIGAANRDPERFADPAAFNPARADNVPLSFGAGAHFCVGAALARLEGEIAFPLLLEWYPRIAAAGTPVRRDRLVLRGYEKLPVTVR